MPTPPAAAWISTFSPGWRPARSTSPYQAVAKTAGTEAAVANDQPSGIGTRWRTSATACVPSALSNRPITRSPTARPVTPGPSWATTPAPSLPGSAAPGYMPSAISTSRKLRPQARIVTRTSPGPSGRSAIGAATRWSMVPASRTSTRHGAVAVRGGGSALASLGAKAAPSRRASSGSVPVRTDGSAR